MALGYQLKPKWLRKRYVEQQKSIREMADEADVSGATILRALRKAGIPTRGNAPRPGMRSGTKLKPHQVRQARKWWEDDGWSMSDIADHYGVSKQAISQLINGVTHKDVE